MNKNRSRLVEKAVDPLVPESNIVKALREVDNEEKFKELPRGPSNFKNVFGMMEYLTVSRTQIWKMRRAGLPHYTIGAKIVFKPEEVDAWLLKNGRKV